MRNHYVMEKAFETDDAHSYFISRFYLHPKFKANNINDSLIGINDTNSTIGVNGANSAIGTNGANSAICTNSANGANSTNLTSNEQMILDYLKMHTVDTTKKIAENLPLSLRSIQRCIHSLKEKGAIDFQGSRKNGKWVVQRGD